MSSEEKKNFQDRFKGKTSIMDKSGIVGIVKSKGAPINKNDGLMQYKMQPMLNNSPEINRDFRIKTKSLPDQSISRKLINKQQTQDYSKQDQYDNDNSSEWQDIISQQTTQYRSPQMLQAYRTKEKEFRQDYMNSAQDRMLQDYSDQSYTKLMRQQQYQQQQAQMQPQSYQHFPYEYELVAVPKIFLYGNQQSDQQSGYKNSPQLIRHSHNILNFNNKNQTPQSYSNLGIFDNIQMTQSYAYPTQQANWAPNQNQYYSQHSISQSQLKQGFMQNAVNMLDNKRKQSYQYELDELEEKHRDIINNFDRVNELRSSRRQTKNNYYNNNGNDNN